MTEIRLRPEPKIKTKSSLYLCARRPAAKDNQRVVQFLSWAWAVLSFFKEEREFKINFFLEAACRCKVVVHVLKCWNLLGLLRASLCVYLPIREFRPQNLICLSVRSRHAVGKRFLLKRLF